jgi:hypothetical protein
MWSLVKCSLKERRKFLLIKIPIIQFNVRKMIISYVILINKVKLSGLTKSFYFARNFVDQ